MNGAPHQKTGKTLAMVARNRSKVILCSMAMLIVAMDPVAAREGDERPRILREITIPTLDISGESERQVIVAQGTKRVWQGHPHTLLMPDGKTMFCVWQGRREGNPALGKEALKVIGKKGDWGLLHGAPGGFLKRSDDGGLTWSGLLDIPANWHEIGRGAPTIHRLVDPKGVARLFVFSRTPDRSSMLQAVSEDDGVSWSPAQRNKLLCWTAPQTVVPVEGGRKYLMWYERNAKGDPDPGVIWQSATTDGGLTWGDSRPVVEFAGASEPAVVRSPDGGQLLLLIRQNTRRHNSVYATSDDEGKTWSKARELPSALTGDRHEGVYTPDGRLVIVFRDHAEGSATKHKFVGWVGRYEDIVEGREGQYRVKLLPTHADTGYPGIEILPDGTIVAITYAKLKPDELHSVIGTRFKIGELDRKLKL